MTSTQFRLRPFRRCDVPTIAGFEREIAKVSFPDEPITELDFYIRKLSRQLGDEGIHGVVAEDDTHGIIGWAYMSKRKNFITQQEYADFHSIYVSPEGRGTGVARALMENILEFCRRHELQRVVFRTRATNERMQKLLGCSGFVPTQIYYEKSLQ